MPPRPERQNPQRPMDTLTAREHEIVLAVADGLRNKEIAAKYGITEETVKRHLSNIFDKLGCDNRTQMALRYHGGPISGLLRGYVCSCCSKDVLLHDGRLTPTSIAMVTNDGEGFEFRTTCPDCARAIYAAIASALKALRGQP